MDSVLFLDLGHVGEVLDSGSNAVVVLAPGESSLEFAGEVLGYGMPYPEADVGGEIRCRVKDLVGAHPRGGRPNDVAHCIAAGLPGTEPHLAQQPQDRRALSQRNMVELDIFSGGDVAFTQRGVFFGDCPQSLQRLRCQDAPGDFHPNHLDIGLPLSVNTLPKPEGRKLGSIFLAGFERGRLLFQALDLVFHVWDDTRRSLGQFQTFPVDYFLGS